MKVMERERPKTLTKRLPQSLQDAHILFFSIFGFKDRDLTDFRSLKKSEQQHKGLPVVMISGHGNIETAVSAIKIGAYDFIEKPFKSDRLVLVAERALEAYQLRREISALRQRAGAFDQIVGSSRLHINYSS